jgi:hypothetical protein
MFMPRRRESIMDLLLILPWWVCLIVAATSYALLVYLAPLLVQGSNVTALVTKAGEVVTAVFVLLGMGGALRSMVIARRFNRQRRTNLTQDAYHPHPQVEPTNWGNRSNTTFGLSDEAPRCPSCGKSMVLRAARRGAKAGSQFWGCSGHPECQGMREI